MSPPPSPTPPPPPPVSDAELEVLKVLWSRGSGTVRDVEADLHRGRGRGGRGGGGGRSRRRPSRLRDKGYVASDASGEGAALVFRPTVSRDQLLRHGLSDLADRICDGTASPLVHALVQGQRFSPQEIADFRRLLDELESKE
jgi:BlaI family transcriptional regulator, penicillinase repressor